MNLMPTPGMNPPCRVHASSFLKFDREFIRAIELSAGRAAANNGVVLILLDCEDGCPATLGPRIQEQAQAVRGDVTHIVCLAYREFETWFLYAASSLAGKSGLPADLCAPESPESFRDAKGWLGAKMQNGYTETTHQVVFASEFYLDQASQSASFRRLVDRLLPHL